MGTVVPVVFREGYRLLTVLYSLTGSIQLQGSRTMSQVAGDVAGVIENTLETRDGLWLNICLAIYRSPPFPPLALPNPSFRSFLICKMRRM